MNSGINHELLPVKLTVENDIMWNDNEFIITDYCGQVWESKDGVNWSYSSLGGSYQLFFIKAP